MSPHTNHYKAYSAANRTVAKTRQVVMLYDGAIRYVKQASRAIEEGLIEDRFKLLTKASEIMVGLQNSLDFEKGGDITNVLLSFYSNISRRIIMVNFSKATEVAQKQCEDIIAELKQMRDTWESIDQAVAKPEPHVATVQTSANGTTA